MKWELHGGNGFEMVYAKWNDKTREPRTMTITRKAIVIKIYNTYNGNINRILTRKRNFQPTDSEIIEAAYQAGFEPSTDVIGLEKRFKAELLKEATKFLTNITRS